MRLTMICMSVVSGLVLGVCGALGLGPSLPDPPETSRFVFTAKDVIPSEIIIVYDNNRFNPRLETQWGFSCVVRGFGKTVLFDTGGDSAILLGNMRKIGIEPFEVEVLVLSHIHGDHTGGVRGFLEANSKVDIYTPVSFPEDFKMALRSAGARIIEISGAEEMLPGVHTTGELGGWIKEQSLVLTTEKGAVVITGCAHPGIEQIVLKANQITGQKSVFLVVGGFHLTGASESRIEAVANGLRRLSVEKASPCHCSGDIARRTFERIFGTNYIECGAGTILKLSP